MIRPDVWIHVERAAHRLQQAGYETEHQKHWLNYRKRGVSGRIAVTGDNKVDEMCLLRLEDRGS